MGCRTHISRGAIARRLGLIALVCVIAGSPRAGHAQDGVPAAAIPGILTAGGELDSYLRYLASMGRAPDLPWSLRAFSPAMVDSLVKISGDHPWSDSWLFRPARRGRHFWLLPANVSARYNSAYPFGGNDGPIWAGRGVTVATQLGVAGRWGPLTVVLDPIAFVAQNQPFAMVPTGEPGNGRFANPDFPTAIDLPQRFGDRSYGRLDPGNSVVRLDLGSFGIGATTANQWWGPATTYPVILGNNAPGVPHVFLGTNRPVNVLVGRAQVRVLYGIEQQSAFSPVQGSKRFTDPAHPGTTRFMSGLVVTFSPGAVPGLELGGARYFHQAWFGRVGSAELRTPFEGLLKASLKPGMGIPGVDNRDVLKNQLASVFARWVLPRSGFEVYTEYGREDHNWNARDLAGEPDHSRIAMLGFRKVLRHTGHHFAAMRAEVFDGTASPLSRHRGEGGAYIHSVLAQGHTVEGQLIGADVGPGSPAGASLALDLYSPRGRSSWIIAKASQGNGQSYPTTGRPSSFTSLVLGTIGYQTRRFGRFADLLFGATATLLRGSERAAASNSWNLGLAAGISWHGTGERTAR